VSSTNDAGYWPPDPVEEAAALIAEGKVAAAIDALRALVSEGRGGVRAHLALVRALVAAGDTQEALLIAREASALAPQDVDVALTLGDALNAAGDLPAAIGACQRAVRIEPQHAGARLALVKGWIEAGEAAQARAALSEAAAMIDAQSINEITQAITNLEGMARRSPQYVRHLFDQFSTDYDARMLQLLQYRAPQILLDLARLLLGPKPPGTRTLDLGCGTGLSGLAFKPFATELEGIDLAPRMIEAARARNIYDRLDVADIETALDGSRRYGRIIAADVLVYLGDLAPLFAGVARTLEPGGLFLFTVEAKSGDDPAPFALQSSKRYHHREDYLRSAAEAAGLSVRGLLQCTPRFDAGKPVPGYAVAVGAG